MRIASFDIGKKNFAWYIEEVDACILEELSYQYSCLDKFKKRRAKGAMNSDIENIQEKLQKDARRINMGVVDLRSGNEDVWDIAGRRNLFDFLSSKHCVLSLCDTFVIEQQYFNTFSSRGRKSPGTGANVDAIKIAENLTSWLLLTFPSRNVISFSSLFKTHMMGAPDSLTKPQRKKWTDIRARKILEERGDSSALQQLSAYKKKKQKTDDICDAIMQCQAYKYKCLVAKF